MSTTIMNAATMSANTVMPSAIRVMGLRHSAPVSRKMAEMSEPAMLMPMFKSMLGIPMKDREHAQWSFGYPVTLADKRTVH